MSRSSWPQKGLPKSAREAWQEAKVQVALEERRTTSTPTLEEEATGTNRRSSFFESALGVSERGEGQAPRGRNSGEPTRTTPYRAAASLLSNLAPVKLAARRRSDPSRAETRVDPDERAHGIVASGNFIAAGIAGRRCSTIFSTRDPSVGNSVRATGNNQRLRFSSLAIVTIEGRTCPN